MSTTTLAQRNLIAQLSKTKTSAEISARLGLSIWTVRKWRQRLSKKSPIPAMGRPKKGALSSFCPRLVQRIKQLREKHPGWGAASILDELLVQYDYQMHEIPAISSINRFLKEEGLIHLSYEKHGVWPKLKTKGAKLPHDQWEVDAQGAVSVAGLKAIAFINMKDNCSLKYCMSFPIQVRHTRHQPNKIHYQWAFRFAFEESGLPKCIQLDKASVFIENTSKSPYPSKIHLWLTALGISVVFITLPPPLKQAKVERTHQTIEKQVLKGQAYKNWGQLFRKAKQRRKRLNETLPCRSIGKKAPLQAYPEAKHSGRAFSVEQEYQLIDLKKVDQLMSQYIWYRKVSKDKTISMGKNIYYLKKAKPLSQVKIKYSKITRLFIVRDGKDQLVAKLTPKGLSKEEMIGYTSKELKLMKKKILKAKDFPFNSGESFT